MQETSGARNQIGRSPIRQVIEVPVIGRRTAPFGVGSPAW
jgi:hypothetical protein